MNNIFKNTKNLFPEDKRTTPKVYAYSDAAYPNLLKIGYTTREDVNERILEQYPTIRPTNPKLEWYDFALKNDGTFFSDKDIHKLLVQKGIEKIKGEWFKCTIEDVKNAFLSIRENKFIDFNRFLDFKMRPEQEEAVTQTFNYFINFKKSNKDDKPRFLWNAKMRFGKTFTSYQLAKKMQAKRILIITFKPAVENSWKNDLMNHIDFDKYYFFSFNEEKNIESFASKLNKDDNLVCFGSFQNLLGKNETSGIKVKNKFIHENIWDLIIIDEYHLISREVDNIHLVLPHIFNIGRLEKNNAQRKRLYILLTRPTKTISIYAENEDTYDFFLNIKNTLEKNIK